MKAHHVDLPAQILGLQHEVVVTGPMANHVSLRIRTFLMTLMLGACATDGQRSDPDAPEQATPPAVSQASQAAPFALRGYEAFSRADAVAIAEQEWRRFGQRVNDQPPRRPLDPDPYENLSRAPGYWQRIGEYWWLGQDDTRREAAWTGMHDEGGSEFEERREDYFAWSAAFISYLMRAAGAGPRFPYAPSHSTYINISKQMRLGRASGWVVTAERLEEYAPVVGDLVCYSRERRPLRYEKLPLRRFASHCDMVVSRAEGSIAVIGGNVDHAVALKNIPVTTDGRLAESRDKVLDGRYPWFVVVRVLYDR